MKQETIDRIRKFVKDRDWAQFHTEENLAKSIAIEASELLECFQWSSEYDEQHVKEELADVIIYCQDLLDRMHLDVDEIVNMKMDIRNTWNCLIETLIWYSSTIPQSAQITLRT